MIFKINIPQENFNVPHLSLSQGSKSERMGIKHEMTHSKFENDDFFWYFVLDEFYIFVYFVSLFWGSCSFKPPFPTRINFGTIADLFIVRFLLRF